MDWVKSDPLDTPTGMGAFVCLLPIGAQTARSNGMKLCMEVGLDPGTDIFGILHHHCIIFHHYCIIFRNFQNNITSSLEGCNKYVCLTNTFAHCLDLFPISRVTRHCPGEVKEILDETKLEINRSMFKLFVRNIHIYCILLKMM